MSDRERDARVREEDGAGASGDGSGRSAPEGLGTTTRQAPSKAPDKELPVGPGDAPDQQGDPSGREGSLWTDAWRELRSNPLFIASAVLILLFVLMALFPEAYTSFYPGFDSPRDCQLSRSLQRPSAQYWFGFDIQGCDYYANTVYGARVSVTIGVLVTGSAAIIAIIFGSLSAYYGGILDAIIARFTDVWFALPFILGGIVFLSVLGHSFFMVSFVLILLGWPTMLRLVRSSVLEQKEQDYVDAARALGANDARIIVKHILPNALAPVIVYGTIYVGIVISAEAALSYLGVGLQLPAISWGLMINAAQARILSSPHLLVFPGLFLSVAVFSFILMGDALRDALDPKLR